MRKLHAINSFGSIQKSKRNFLLFLWFLFPSLLMGGDEMLVLDQRKAEDIAVENSPEMKLISSQQSIKTLIVKENWRTYFPTASVSWFRNANVIENESDSRSQRLALTMEQIVFDGGRRSLALQAALNDLNLSRYDFLLAVNNLKFKVRSAYFNLLSNKAQFEMQNRSIERQKEQLRFAKREQQLGETTEVQVLQIENRLNEIILQNKRTESSFLSGIEEFKIQLRLPSSARIRLAADILNGITFNYKELPLDQLVGLAFRSRVEFDRTKAAELQAMSEYEIAKSFYIPSISVGGFYAASGDRFEPKQREYGFNFRVSMALGANTLQDTSNYISRNDDTNRSLTSTTTLGIMDNLQYKRKIAQTGIAAEQARLTRAQLDDIIRIEVSKALQNYRLAWEALKLADENAKVFEKRLRIKEKQVGLGDVRRVDLAETEIFYVEAVNAMIANRVQFMTAVSQLEMAVGANLDSLELIKTRTN
ncbi:channel protein TolC [Leptospira perolatii]|uniref:Channel protein TolC n=1 Tax=Leptospira perolatii TaxID=2023191 RepID=A0A2M9ZN30_9LEPT|nr:TolC family protein [Leptospira perolatii]PJZ68269.1 channel protein TolC [Leptospira perolatii]PJZ73381.1 channel protein TolC [Leptospira perolatii]